MENKNKQNVKFSPAEIKKLKSSSGGQPIPASLKHGLEIELKTDLSNVRVHTSDEAMRAATILNAQAFTVGTDIYFNAGQYQPGTNEGRRLLAHELTHVVQQKNGQ